VGTHDTTDEYLEETARKLEAMGALRYLEEDLPWQCCLIKHFALVKTHLFA
jgi:hypothetical protein